MKISTVHIMSGPTASMDLDQATELTLILHEIIGRADVGIRGKIDGKYWDYWEAGSDRFPLGTIIVAMKP